MKSTVLKVLRDTSLTTPNKYNALMELLSNTTEANPVSLRSYNQAGANEQTIALITYDLQKFYGIKDAELRPGYIDPSKNLKAVKAASTNAQISDDAILGFDLKNANYHKDLKPFALALALAKNIELPDANSKTLIDFIQEQQNSLQPAPDFVNPFTDASIEAKQGLKLRDEFPFLSDPNAPIKLKGLVTDKLTAFYAVLDARKELFGQLDEQGNLIEDAPLNEERALDLCKSAVENFELNQLIYDELNHFKEHGIILGKHPVFAAEVLQREVDEMSDNDAHKAIRTINTYISKEKKKLASAKTDESTIKIQQVIEGHVTKIDLLKIKLGLEK